MKFRTLGVALLMGSGLALSAVAASSAVAQPHPPAGCTGPFGTGTVTDATVEVGDTITFTGCGHEPSTAVQIAIDGVPFGTVLVESDTTWSIEVTLDTPGQHTVTGTGQYALSLLLANVPTGPAAGTDGVPAQAPFLTRVVSADVLVTDWGHGGGGWGEPSGGPSGYPSDGPSGYPTDHPSGYPTDGSSGYPTDGSSGYPTDGSSGYPTDGSSGYPTDGSSGYPTDGSSGYPTDGSSGYPTDGSSGYPTESPTGAPSGAPTVAPNETVTPPHHARPPHHDRRLPFTGIETGALAAIAVALVGGGFLIRVAARKRRNAGGTHS